jgi:hypothetical protein
MPRQSGFRQRKTLMSVPFFVIGTAGEGMARL